MPKAKAALSAYQEKMLIQLEDEGLAFGARNSLAGFTIYTKPDYQMNWHHELMCEKLDRFARGEIKRLMIFAPPRHGKSELVSRRLPPFMFGHRPTLQIVSASYSDSLSSSINRDVQRIMESPAFGFLFPKSKLGAVTRNVTGSVRNNSFFELPTKGSYRSVGVGSGLTGHGADVLLIDDPIKNKKEADSKVYRDNVWDWYQSTAYTRLEKNGQVLVLMTRWHEDDLAGRLLEQAKTDPSADQWEVIDLPAVKETAADPNDIRKIGEALWPWKYPLEKLMKIKHSVGTRVWGSLFQQRPAPQEGAIIKREWLKFYRELPADARLYGEWVQSWDLSFKGNDTSDFVVGQVWVKYQANFYLVHQVRARMTFTATKVAIESLSAKFPWVKVKLIENKANGPAVIDSLKETIGGIVAVEVSDSKIARLNAVSPDFEAGNVHLPHPSIAPYIHDYISELTSFPTATNDDQVDGTTQALMRLRTKTSGDFSKELVPKSNKTIASKAGKTW